MIDAMWCDALAHSQALRRRRDASAPPPPLYIVHGEGGMGTGKRNSIKPAFTLLLASVGDADSVAFAQRVSVRLLMPLSSCTATTSTAALVMGSVCAGSHANERAH